MQLLELIDMKHYFDFIVTSSDVAEPKPSPAPYLMAMNLLSMNPEECVIIEDSESGFKSAISSGAMTIGITTTLSSSDIHDINSDINVFDSYADINKFLLQII